MDRLYHLLDVYNQLPVGERDPFESRLWEQFGENRTVLVLDMSGFSRIARSKGIVFYLAMIRRMQEASAPLVSAHRGAVVKFEADNLFAVFYSPSDALDCAIAINETLHAANHRQQDEVAYIRVSIGIELGRILVIPGKDFFGDAVNIAAKLGEDLAEASEILIAERAAAALPEETKSRFATKRFTISGIAITALSLDLSDDRDPGVELYEGTPLD